MTTKPKLTKAQERALRFCAGLEHPVDLIALRAGGHRMNVAYALCKLGMLSSRFSLPPYTITELGRAAVTKAEG